MAVHLPVQLDDGPAAFVPCQRRIPGDQKISRDSVQTVMDARAPVEPPSGGNRNASAGVAARDGSTRTVFAGPKICARPEYVPLWNRALNVSRSDRFGS